MSEHQSDPFTDLMMANQLSEVMLCGSPKITDSQSGDAFREEMIRVSQLTLNGQDPQRVPGLRERARDALMMMLKGPASLVRQGDWMLIDGEGLYAAKPHSREPFRAYALNTKYGIFGRVGEVDFTKFPVAQVMPTESVIDEHAPYRGSTQYGAALLLDNVMLCELKDKGAVNERASQTVVPLEVNTFRFRKVLNPMPGLR